ncbi:SemiSWEET family sugar transporter [Amphritea atlantica]|uniref:SemiSWEET family sugar transporter n=1 Tax=Amphritea atlantica TaxID=355243 RepID=A0ABY5H1C9_9GAMM|nr:SemiSWEET family sugar transporter [Amphritea atlantica]
MSQWIGIAAACCTTLSFVPQVIQILKSRDTAGISVAMYTIFTTGVFFWVVYGFVIWDLPVLLANSVTLILTLSVLMLTITQRLRTRNVRKTTARQRTE